MRLVCSPHLSSKDAEAMETSESFSVKEIDRHLGHQLQKWDEASGNTVTSSLLRHLCASGLLEVRIGVLRSDSRGILHCKEGIFCDGEDSITFIGSANETASGWSDIGNYESIEVFRSWEREDRRRVERFRREFEEMWVGGNRKVRLLKADQLPSVFVPRDDDLSIDQCRKLLRDIYAGEEQRIARSPGESPKRRPLQDHQEKAINNWIEAGYRGLITFVTGGGKTLTAIEGIRRWLERGSPVLVLVPSRLLVRQWRQEIEYELADLDVRIQQVGAGVASNIWSSTLRAALSKSDTHGKTVVLATYQSAQTQTFLDRVPSSNDLLLVCDEVHRIGAVKTRQILRTIDAGARLGLSATPTRFGDIEGTSLIYEYFGDELAPSFSLQDAIRSHRLVPYTYELVTVSLSNEEEEHYDKVSADISLIIARNDGKIPQDNPRYDALVRERAQIVKEATGKDHAVSQKCLSMFKAGDRLLIYCNSRNQISRIVPIIRKGFEQLENGYRVIQYHSELTEEQKQASLNYFTNNGGVLVAIKCLDEGVDIPVLNKAIIAASSQNPREYIQRRGRVLRSAPGHSKFHADIVDCLVLRQDGTVVQAHELQRAVEFSTVSVSRSASLKIKQLAHTSNIDLNQYITAEAFEEAEEDEDE